jgi:hypothetical protein
LVAFCGVEYADGIEARVVFFEWGREEDDFVACVGDGQQELGIFLL